MEKSNVEFVEKVAGVICNSLKGIASVVVAIVVIVVVSIGTTIVTDYFKRANDLKKSGLESKLLWNNIGQCFYAELDDFNKYYKIVRVEDCDKTK
jgi:hypothetical protein